MVPNVVGRHVAAAEGALADAGCAVGAIAKKSSTAPKDSVIASQPAAGTKLDQGASVALIVSGTRVKRSCKVPDLVGKKLTSAEAAITHSGCAVGKIKKVKLNKKFRKLRGLVLSQNPRPGTSGTAGLKVGLRVGK